MSKKLLVKCSWNWIRTYHLVAVVEVVVEEGGVGHAVDDSLQGFGKFVQDSTVLDVSNEK